MKSIRKLLIVMVVCSGLLAGLHLVHAQTAVIGNFNSDLSLVQAAAPDSIVQVVADGQNLSLVSPGQAPRSGTFWWILPSGTAVPAPCPPLDLTAPIYQLAGGQFLVDQTGGQIPAIPRRFGMQAQTTGSMAVSGLELEADTVLSLITRVQTGAANQQMRMMGMNLPIPGDGGGDSGGGTNGVTFQSNDYSALTNGLWLEITNVSGGLAYLNLHNATDAGGVYEIFTKTDLSAPSWNIETDLWPTDTICMPFTIPVLDRTNTLFVWARDWTGVDENNNGYPDWQEWESYGYASISANPQTVMVGTNQSASIILTATSQLNTTKSLDFTIVADPTNGSLTGTGTNLTYTPYLNYEGMDHFTFSASDGLWSNSATVTIFVVAGPTHLVAQCPTNGAGILLNWGLDDKVQKMETDDDLTIAGFEIYRRTEPGLFATNDIIYITTDSSQTNYLDMTVRLGTNYYYEVDFLNYEGDPYYFEQITYKSPFSNEATNTACSPPSLGTNGVDVVYILDNTISMLDADNLLTEYQNAITNAVAYIEYASGGNCQFALVTPDMDGDIDPISGQADDSGHDMVVVHIGLTNDVLAFEAAVEDQGLPGEGGYTTESTDQCLNTVVNALKAFGRTNDDGCLRNNATPVLQYGDFRPAFRTNALKLVVLITDAGPSGFCD